MLLRCACAAAVVWALALPAAAQAVDCENLPPSAGLEPEAVRAACRRPLVALSPPALAPTDSAVGFQARENGAHDAYVTFALSNPGTVRAVTEDSLLAPDGTLTQGCDFDDSGDFSRAWCLSLAGAFFRVDLESSAVTPVGTAAAAAGEVWTALTFDRTTGGWYAMASACNTSSALYRIDPATGAATPIGGAGTALRCAVGMGADSLGVLYAVDVTSDSLFRVDKASGAQEGIGALGFNANFAQGMDFDDDDGTCYLFAYTAGGDATLRTCDVETGVTTVLGLIGTNNELTTGMIANRKVAPGTEAGPAAHGFSLSAARPNPVAGVSRVAVEVARAQRLRVDVLDVVGRVVATLYDAPAAAGRLTLPFDADGLAGGVYVLRVTGERGVLARRVTVLN
jgi:hypothetical protein